MNLEPKLLTGADSRPRKSVLASGALSLVFGPLGWLYAAPLKEAAPAIAVYLFLGWLLPHFVLLYLLGIVSPISAIAGVLYAWSFNQEGRRAPLLGSGGAARRALPGRRRGQ